MHSNRYIFLYALGVTSIVAVVLAVAVGGLRSRQEANVEAERKRAILSSVMQVNPDTLDADYENIIRGLVFDAAGREVEGIEAEDIDVAEESRKPPQERIYPVYIATDAGVRNYIIPIEGSGLWGPIRAFVALEADANTISGIVFDQEKETPGLGAEIDTPAFGDRFRGKRLFDDDGTFRSVIAVKNAPEDQANNPHEVDGLTGATMTMNGVNRMMEEDLGLYQVILSELSSREP